MLIDSAALTRLSLLKAIRQKGPISRVALSSLLGLSKGLVSEVTADLIESGMVNEEVSSTRERGRPRVLLDIQADSLAVVGVALNSDGGLELTLVDLSGRLVSISNAPFEKHDTIDSLVRWIAETLKDFVATLPIDRTRIASVAVAIPGVVETSAGLIGWIPTFSDSSVAAARIIADHINIPVVVENDIDCLARAEHWFGNGQDSNDFTIVLQGMTVGLAQYTGGLPRTALSGINSEFAHVKTDYSEDARPCFCGARGCLTGYSSYRGFAAASSFDAEHAATDTERFAKSMLAIIDDAERGEPYAVALCESAGRHLGLALAGYINTLDPRVVLIKTADPRMPALIKAALYTALEANVLPILLQRTTVELASALPDWRWKGTAALGLEQVYLGTAVRKSRQIDTAYAEAG